ncbi:hypothetical protein HYH02_010387 [Chlamydomonas schloesseri]|uniref:Uncharacterized protein n=1 Tax=Chlamydomonas schloesseri TaxID=2026947 RepID=A0A835THL6_9CHLO|nr:hypothetical protein HYH02_010387 [Chlamydomonas schloesseri]|eukprot:KAG2440509.1 hypothetical protein HYH02_010387 [Chlamydomonas schloesseri]
MTTTLANPQAILATLKRFRQTRGLVLLESIHKVAEEAAPAGADAAAARALRARKLGRFLLHLAFSLQKEEEEQKQLSAAARGRGAARGRYGEALSRCRGSGGSGDDGAAGQGGAAAPRTSVLVCNMRVGSPNSFDSLLQQYASMRLRLTRAGGDGDRSAAALVPRVHDGAAGGAVPGAAAADVVAARGLARVVTAHMLKGPGVTSRMSAPSCSLYLPPPGQAASVAAGGAGAATSGGTSGAPVLRAVRAGARDGARASSTGGAGG